MTWHLGPLCAFDLETTGVDPETARIVTATVVHINGATVDSREWLVDPGIEIPEQASAIHGVTTERARAEGIDPVTAAALIFAALDEAWTAGRPVIIYNASYDLTVLDRELRRHCGTSIADVIGPVIDPFVIDKHLDPYRRGKRTLTAACAHYGVRLEGAHTSTGDALAVARVAYKLAQKYPDDLGDLAILNELQAAWRSEWASEFEKYLARQGKPEQVDGQWPLRVAS